MADQKTNQKIVGWLCLAFLLISGVNGCPAAPPSAARDIDFSLLQSLDTLSEGKSIAQGEVFYVVLQISNPEREARTGQACIADNIGDNYGGIARECKPFFVRPSENGAAASELSFGPFSYSGIPLERIDAILFVDLDYIKQTRLESAVPVPLPQIQQLEVGSSTPIAVAVNKSIRRVEQGYKVDLGIMLKKQEAMAGKEVRIFSPDLSKENTVYFSIEMPPQSLECTAEGVALTRSVGFEKEKFIRCSTQVYLGKEEQLTYPLVLRLDYGVRLSSQVGFSITK